jgi:uncharacterized protein (DUF924 family)
LSGDWRAEVTEFWFHLNHDDWFNADPVLDHRIKQRFFSYWASQRQLPAETFLHDPREALAAVILFDQFPRNMFRGNAEQFATDHLALAIATRAIEKHFDTMLCADERAFLYLPFEHSEDLADQNRSVHLFTALGDARFLKFAKLHHDVIARFGRFPHRNAVLGRAWRDDEAGAHDLVPW